MPPRPQRRVVLTGGPCAGKTTISEVLAHAFAGRLVILPESASLLFSGGFPRWSEDEARAALQRAIYRTQREIEIAFTVHHPAKLHILDRATVDGAAYWPAGPDDFFARHDTTLDAELARYDRVLFLESAGEEAYEINRRRNPNRVESWDQARHLDEQTRALWERHPRFTLVTNQRSFSQKISEVLRLIEEELEGPAR